MVRCGPGCVVHRLDGHAGRPRLEPAGRCRSSKSGDRQVHIVEQGGFPLGPGASDPARAIADAHDPSDHLMGHEPAVRKPAPKEPTVSTYSTSFFRGSHTGPQAVVYTNPSGHTTVIRQITAYNAGGTTDAFEVAIGTPGNAFPIWHISNVAAAADSRAFEGRVVLQPGDNIYVASGG